jgi:hypothetical protein
MSTDFEMFVRVLIDEGASPNREPLDPCRQWHRTNNLSSGPLSRSDNPFCRLIKYSVIICFQSNSNLLCHICLVKVAALPKGLSCRLDYGMNSYLDNNFRDDAGANGQAALANGEGAARF